MEQHIRSSGDPRSAAAPVPPSAEEPTTSGEETISGDVQFRLLAEASPFGILLLDACGKVSFVNRRLVEMSGRDPEEIAAGAPDGTMLHPDDRERVVAEVTAAFLDRRELGDLEQRLLRPDGDVVWTRSRTTTIVGDDGEFLGYLSTIEDISNQVVERASVDRLLAMLDATPDYASIVDAHGRILFLNPAARRLFGLEDGQDVATVDYRTFFPEWAVARIEREMWPALADGHAWTGELALLSADGSEIPISLTTVVSRGDDGTLWYASILRDISTLKDAEARSTENETWFRTLFQNLTDIVVVQSDDGRMLYASPSIERVLGYDVDEVLEGRDASWLAIHPDDLEAVQHAGRRVEAEPGATARVAARARHKDGSWRWLDATLHNLLDEPAVGGIVINANDVTAEKEHQRALLENEARFQALTEHASVIITILESDGTQRYTSPSASHILGYPEGWGDGKSAFDEIHPDDVERLWSMFQSAIQVPGSTETTRFRIRHADGSWRELEAVGNNLLDDPSVRGVLITARDVTEQLAAERALRASEERFRALVHNLSDIVIIVNEDSTVRWISPAAERVLGYGPGEVPFNEPYRDIHPDDRDHVYDVVAAQLVSDGPHEPFSFRIRHADGSWRQLEAVIDDLRDNPSIAGIVITSRDVTESQESKAQLAASEERYREIVEDQTELICRYDDERTLTFVNEAYARYFAKSVDELVGTAHTPFVPEDDVEAVMAALRSLGPDHPMVTIEHRVVRPDGALRWHEWTHRVVLDSRGAVSGFGALGRDITEQREAEALVSDQARILEMIARGAPLPETLRALCEVVETHAPEVMCSVALVDEASPNVLRGGAAPSLPEGIVHAFDGLVIGPRAGSCGTAAHLGEPVVVTDIEIDPLWADLRQVALDHGIRAAWSSPIMTSAEDIVLGTFCLYSREPSAPTRRHQQLVDMVVHHAAVAIERKQFETQLAHQAHHDPLTRLPNRVLFMEFLVVALARARRHKATVAVLFLDLDRFKVVNDSLGHDAGDDLLIALAERLRSVLRPGDTVARFGGDEFTILCEDLSGPQAKQQAVEVADRLLEVIHQPFLLEGDEHFLSASIGIALASSGDDRPDALLRDADAAMYKAKERGKGRWELFDETMRETALQRLDIENALHRAIDRGEFRVFYQPYISIPHGRCVGAEALVRWQHPERGLVAPMEFIGLAEETGIVVPLGRWVLDEACRQAARWHAERTETGPFQVSVNLSGRQLSHPDLVDHVAAAIERTGIDPACLCLEITESVLMDDVDATITTLRRLKALGVLLSIDDFGTGYSSLGYLKRFPVDFVKVDRSFVKGLGSDPEDSAIVAAVVSLGHALGLQVVAEGVEDEVQLSELVELGCDQAQGYLFAPPQAALDVHEAMTRPLRWRSESGLR